MATVTLADLDSVQILSNKWFYRPRQILTNVDTLFKHGTINAALSNIGTTTKTTIVVTENTSVTANTDLTSYPNIHWMFLGNGKLTPATGVTLTLYSGDTITCPPYQQCLDASNGTITFAKAGWVWPGWFGATPGASASAGKTALQKLALAFGSVGGGIHWPGHTIQVDDTIAFTGPVTIRGIQPSVSILESTADDTDKHGLTFTRSASIEDLQVKTSASLTSNQEMHGIRFDMDALTAPGQFYNLRRVKVVGFNAGIYADGGDNYNIDRATLDDIDIQTSGPASDYVGSCVYLNRMTQLRGTNLTLDQNDTGEHALYYFGSKNVVLDGLKIRNATRGEAQAIKLVGNGTGSDDDQVFPVWNVKNFDIADCTNSIMAVTYGTERLGALKLENGRITDVTGTSNIPGVLFVEALGTSVVESVSMDNVSIRNVGYQGMHLSTAAGATIQRASMRDVTAYNWGTVGPAGTYTLFGTNGSGTFGPIDLRNIDADGNSNGRTIVGASGMASTVSRVTFSNLRERNTTAAERPIADSSTSATFNFALGNAWTVSGTRTVTAASNAVPGEVYHIVGTNANCTFTDGAVFALNGNWVSAANKSLTLLCLTTSTFQELSRTAS